ncbi:hypothetical protein IVB12_00600 [Bradyrhizobium sp. 179]|uniref:hypothetical protein n=1 Tax=Bradyrhizobium sp. 179 TaxID=2782648 RepID=UPI001FF73FEA|nr:hypothetical protein [Bradyrhizobium sp. 179]MCK1540530.1 hypothetical protein [Bradyrhizobium sp. 179]
MHRHSLGSLLTVTEEAVDASMILLSENGYLFGCSEAVLVADLGGDQLSRAPHTFYHA